MTKAKYLGARLDREILQMVEDTAHEERVDKTQALKNLIILGRKQLLLQTYLDLYAHGKCSTDKAAQSVGISVGEFMEEAACAGIPSTETVEQYKEGLRILSGSSK